MEKRTNNKKLLRGMLLLLFLGAVSLLIYRAQIEENLNQPVEFTMMTEHKTTGEVILSEESPEFSETFICEVPLLEKIAVCCTGSSTAKAVLVMTISDAQTGEIYYQTEARVREVIKARVNKMVEMELVGQLADSEGKELLLTWKIENAGATELILTANQKQSVVTSFNGQAGNGTNVIYTLYYGNNGFLRNLYGILCAALLFFAGLSYWLLIVMRLPVVKFYVPLALTLGLIVQGLITVNGVPDEPTHIDTAYKYSNKMLLIPDTGTAGTIYKRKCDVVLSDMLANGLESNSYYQLAAHTFEKPESTELVEVSYVDSSGIVTGIVFLPAAAGISVGRLLGASAMLTLQLGRIFDLLFFVLATWLAIRLAPFGKNIFGLVGMLPITLQQGASTSYDSVVNGVIFLFLAICLNLIVEKKNSARLAPERQRGASGRARLEKARIRRLPDSRFRKKAVKWLAAALLAVVILRVKGGVYVPLLGLLVCAVPDDLLWPGKADKKEKLLRVCLFLVAAAAVALAVIWKFLPLLQTYMTESGLEGEDALYTVPYLLKNPLKILYLYWNTLMESGGQFVKGLLGGRLSWLDLEIDWILLLPLLIGLLLLANVEGDRYRGGRRRTAAIRVVCGVCIVLVMASMLVGYTTQKWDSIQGIQGRYFLPVAPLLLMISTNSMVTVRPRQCARIWMGMMAAEAVILLQAAAMAIG